MSELWTQFIEGGSNICFTPEMTLTLVNAAIDVFVRKKGDQSVVSVSHQNTQAVICTLSHGLIPQAHLNIVLQGGCEYTLTVAGENVHLIGYIQAKTSQRGIQEPRIPEADQLVLHQSQVAGQPRVSEKYLWVATGRSSKGLYAQTGDLVELRYQARVGNPRGRVFDENIKGETFKFIIGEEKIIDGISQGVTGMQVGDQRRIFIPPKLGYGRKVIDSPVPPNSHIVYDCKVISIEPKNRTKDVPGEVAPDRVDSGNI